MLASSVLQIYILFGGVYMPSAWSHCDTVTPPLREHNISSDTILNLINPAQGFYRTLITSSIPAIFQSIQENTLNCWRERDGIILLMRKYSLDDYIDWHPLSQNFISNLRQDLETIRAAGWNVVIRFMYSHRIESTYNIHEEPPAANIVTHIQQISRVINDFAGVIIAIQAGFHGEYGLWYDPGTIYAVGDQEKILKALLNNIISTIEIQVPDPKYKWLVVGSQTPTTFHETFPPVSQSSSARIGHYHECLIGGHHPSSVEDAFPDLDNNSAAFNFLKADTNVVLMGGKTCHPGGVNFNTQNVCNASETRFQSVHLSYLDLEDPQEMINLYKHQGCFDRIQKNLGFSFLKTSIIGIQEPTEWIKMIGGNVQFPKTVYQNSDTCIRFEFEIKGYAYPPTDLITYIIFKKENTLGSVEYFKMDTSAWIHPHGSIPVRTVAVQESLIDMESGQYEVFVLFVHNNLEAYPDYYILFSNEKYPFHEFGLNRLDNITILPNSNRSAHLTGNQITRWYPPRSTFHTRIRNQSNGSCSQIMPSQPLTTDKPSTTTTYTTPSTTKSTTQPATKYPLSAPFVQFPANSKVFQTCNKRSVVSALVNVTRYYHSTSAFCPDVTKTTPDVIPKIFCHADDSIIWSPAGRVIDNCDQVEPYTPVAVFQDRFGSIAYESSGISGVFLGCIKDGSVVKGIKIAVQFCGRSFDVVNILLNRNFDTLDKLYIVT